MCFNVKARGQDNEWNENKRHRMTNQLELGTSPMTNGGSTHTHTYIQTHTSAALLSVPAFDTLGWKLQSANEFSPCSFHHLLTC